MIRRNQQYPGFRFREVVRGNGPVERPEPRLGPTSQRSPVAPPRSARPLPYGPSPAPPQPRSTTSDDATGSAD